MSFDSNRIKLLGKLAALGAVSTVMPVVCVAADFYVSPAGSDANPGTVSQPFATIQRGQMAAREMKRTKQVPVGGVRIIIKGGNYTLQEPLLFVREDSGTAESPVSFEAAPGEKPVISGGMAITGWKLAKKLQGLPREAKGKVWVAHDPCIGAIPLDFRQLYVNGIKATRARTPKPDEYFRVKKWDDEKREIVVPAAAVGKWRNLKRVEMIVQQHWAITLLRLDSVTIKGDEARITAQNPESDICFIRPYPVRAEKAPFHFANAIEFLDQPGEWYLDQTSSLLYYYPRPGEDMARAEVIAPVLETLLRVRGTLERPVQYITFKGLEFQHSTWMRPTLRGHNGEQAGMFNDRIGYGTPGGTEERPELGDVIWLGRPPATVYVACSNNIRFERDVFRHLGAAGLDLHFGTHDNSVVGNVFTDIGSNAIQVAKFSDDDVEAHTAYNPKDEREIVTNETVSNNFICDIANEDWGGVGIGIGFGRSINIEHNEVCYTPYTGISVGWGWLRVGSCMRDNKIMRNNVHNVMMRLCDGAGIYSQAPQPESVISENYIHDISPAPWVAWPGLFTVYLDEGSNYFTATDNFSERVLDVLHTNLPGKNSVIERNDAEAPAEVRNIAGLESSYQDIARPFAKNIKVLSP